MSTVIRLIFIVCFAVFFSSNILADYDDIYIQNSSETATVDVSVSDNNYCIHSTSPPSVRVPPNGLAKFEIYYNSEFFSKCGWKHSSQDFNVVITLANGKKYSTTFLWYKPNGSSVPSYLRYIKQPKDKPIGASSYRGYQHGPYAWTVKFYDRKK